MKPPDTRWMEKAKRYNKGKQRVKGNEKRKGILWLNAVDDDDGVGISDGGHFIMPANA